LGGRAEAQIVPVWSKYLEYLTSFNYLQLKECYETLIHRNKVLETISNQVSTPNYHSARNYTKKAFNIKEKKKEIENMRQAIKSKFLALNNKYKSIESLLNDERYRTARKSHRKSINLKCTTLGSGALTSRELFNSKRKVI